MPTKEKKIEIIKSYRKHSKDTGSADVQIAILTDRIHGLNDHLKGNMKDHNSRRSLLKLVGRRRRFLEYIKRRNLENYKGIIGSLGIRR